MFFDNFTMGRFGASLLFLFLAADVCLAQRITPEQIFRDRTYDSNIEYRGNNPSSVSQIAQTPPSAVFSATPISAASTANIAVDGSVSNAYNSYNAESYQTLSDRIAVNVLRIAHDIGQQLSESTTYSKNEVFSPVSITSALSLLMLGARGKSYQELKQLLGLDSDRELRNNPTRYHEEFSSILQGLQRNSDNSNLLSTGVNKNERSGFVSASDKSNHIIKLANGIFTQARSYNLNPSYEYVIRSAYQAQLNELDFRNRPNSARERINEWVAIHTYGKIQNIINSEIPKSTNAILASVLYFKGIWNTSFFPTATLIDDFFPNGTQNPSIKVKMMATGGTFPFYDAKEHNCRIIGLPYKGNETTMYVIQPYDSNRARLKEFQSRMGAKEIEDLIAKMTLKTAVLALPKMHLVQNINLKSVLQALKVNDVFVNGYSDLSLIGEVARYPQTANLPRPFDIRTTQVPTQFQSQTQNQQVIRNNVNRDSLIFSRFGEPTNCDGTDTSTSTRRLQRRAILPEITNNLNILESQRFDLSSVPQSDIFIEDIIHQVDFDVNEYGTEAAAATITYLKRSGTDVLFRADTPFLVLIRHDPTKLVLFYGIIYEPVL